MLGTLSRDQIEEVLRNNMVGRLGCHDYRGMYIVPITYIYDGESIISHTAAGKKIDMLRSNPQVCFQVDEIVDMGNWQSVIAWGKFEELKGEEAITALQGFAEKLASVMTSETAQPGHDIDVGKLTEGQFKTIVYRIRLGKMTGRFEKRTFN